jgi:hypothetical protein
VNIIETSDSTPYSTVIYTDGSKIDGKVRAGAAIYVNQALRRQVNTSYITPVQTIKPSK